MKGPLNSYTPRRSFLSRAAVKALQDLRLADGRRPGDLTAEELTLLEASAGCFDAFEKILREVQLETRTPRGRRACYVRRQAIQER